MKASPAVSVVVPSYNSGHFLRLTLRSIADQSMTDFECIVVDDCSTDNSIASAKEFFSDPRFRLVRHKMNLGLSGARNTGLRAARGKFVAFLDSDDLMMRNSLEVRLNACLQGLKLSDQAAGSYCASMQIEEETQTAPESQEARLEPVSFLTSKGQCPFNANQPMIRRDILRRSGGFNPALQQAEDFDLWIRILRAGFFFAPANSCAVTYRKRRGSMIRRQPLTHLKTSLSIIKTSYRQLTEQQLAWSSWRVIPPLGELQEQSGKLDRILEFIGMNIASTDPEPLSALAQFFRDEIPDFEDIRLGGRNIHNVLYKGIRRQLNSLPDNLKSDVDTFVAMISAKADRREHRPCQAELVYNSPSADRVWFADHQSAYDLIFIPHSAYHVWTISLIGEKLSAFGIRFITVDISAEWRDGGVRAAAREFGLETITTSEFFLGNYTAGVVVVFNDWDPVTRPIVVAAKTAGLKTVAIVEGIQDYDDEDVHWRRHAYKTADTVVIPGEFDRKYFAQHDTDLIVGGIPRIEDLRHLARPSGKKDPKRVLINSNFSYGVLEHARDSWLSSAVAAVLSKGLVPVISRHPGDKGTLFPEFLSSRSFYEELEICDISIQRFASGILEALARGVGVIYFNPHGEKVDKFQPETLGAYEIAKDEVSLGECLKRIPEIRDRALKNADPFLDLHCGPLVTSASERCARALTDLASRPATHQSVTAFRTFQQVLDFNTSALFDLEWGDQQLFASPMLASEKMRKIADATDLNFAVEFEHLFPRKANETDVPQRSLASSTNSRKSESDLQEWKRLVPVGTSAVRLYPNEIALFSRFIASGMSFASAIEHTLSTMQSWLDEATSATGNIFLIDHHSITAEPQEYCELLDDHFLSESDIPECLVETPDPLEAAVATWLLESEPDAIRFRTELRKRAHAPKSLRAYRLAQPDSAVELLRTNKARLRDLEAAVAHKKEKVAEMERVVAESNTRLAGLLVADRHREQRLRACEVDRADLSRQIEAHKAELVLLTQDRDRLHFALSSVKRSTSWRLTAPMRSIGRVIRGSVND